MSKELYNLQTSKKLYNIFKILLDKEPLNLTEIGKLLKTKKSGISDQVSVLIDANILKSKKIGKNKIIMINKQGVKRFTKLDPNDEVNRKEIFDEVSSFGEICTFMKLWTKLKREDIDLLEILGDSK